MCFIPFRRDENGFFSESSRCRCMNASMKNKEKTRQIAFDLVETFFSPCSSMATELFDEWRRDTNQLRHFVFRYWQRWKNTDQHIQMLFLFMSRPRFRLQKNVIKNLLVCGTIFFIFSLFLGSLEMNENERQKNVIVFVFRQRIFFSFLLISQFSLAYETILADKFKENFAHTNSLVLCFSSSRYWQSRTFWFDFIATMSKKFPAQILLFISPFFVIRFDHSNFGCGALTNSIQIDWIVFDQDNGIFVLLS